MSTNKDHLNRVRKSIEDAIERAEEERRRKLLIHRIEVARLGISAFKNGQIEQAVRSFHTYLRILEEVKSVDQGGLKPSSFDTRKDLPELLMLSGVYWDLVKIYDRAKTQGSKKEFLHYLEKYIVFSKGMPFQKLCAESLRKYLNSDQSINREHLTNAYRILSVSQCFVATALADVVSFETIPTLRDFRDRILSHSKLGQLWIRCYYRLGPSLADLASKLPFWTRKILGKGLDRISAGCRYWLNSMDQGTNSIRSKDVLAVGKTQP